MSSSDYDDAIASLHEHVAQGSCHGAAVLIWELLFAQQNPSQASQLLQPTIHEQEETMVMRRQIIPSSMSADVSKRGKLRQVAIPNAQADLCQATIRHGAAIASRSAAC